MIRLKSTKKQKRVRTKISKSSGIYLIRSKVNGKIYIGSAVNLFGRRKSHLEQFKNNSHHNIYLQRHTDKYGIEDLVFGIIEFCPKEKLIEREQYWIDTLKPEFNICRVAGSALGVKWSEEQKQKIRGENSPLRGIPLSKELREQRRLSAIKQWENNDIRKNNMRGDKNYRRKVPLFGKDNPFYEKHHSEETKLKMRERRIAFYNTEKGIQVKQKLKKALQGKSPWNKGLTGVYSEETLEKIRKARLGKSPWNKGLTKNTK
jgi:group I intron endonuclease